MYRARGPEELRPVGQTEFVAGQAAMSESGLYGPTRVAAGIVGFADLTLGDRVEPVLEEHIRAGDIFQVVLSPRMSADVSQPPFEGYRALRVTNPSPYMYFLRLGEFAIVGSSPEVLVRRTDSLIEVRPIADTCHQ